MMPHERCQHSECWLQSFFMQQGITPPLFSFYQLVETIDTVEDDDGELCTTHDRGRVVGMVYNSPDFRDSGWSYTVRFESREEVASSPWVKLPYDDALPESDLRPI